MNFEVPREIKLSKELLLQYNTDDVYMSTYLQMPIKKGLQISKLRSDNRPTVAFYRNNKGEIRYHDFGTGQDFSFIDVVKEQRGCTYWQAIRIIAEDFGIIKKEVERPPIKIIKPKEKIEEKQETLIQIEAKEFSDKELKWWKSFGISKKTLNKFKVYSCASIFLNGNYFSSSTPNSFMFGYYGGKKNGNEMWRIYMPQKKSFRFLSNWDRKMIQGSRMLPNSGDILVIQKSLKDTMLLYELGIPAIAPNSETVLICKEQMEKIMNRFKTIIAMGDNDRAGIVALNKLHKTYPNIKCIFIPRSYGAKDLSDLVKKIGIEKVKDEIEKAKKFLGL